MSRSFSSVIEPPQLLQICTGAGRKEVALLRVHPVREAQHRLPVDCPNGASLVPHYSIVI
jgi:hypothetical protein